MPRYQLNTIKTTTPSAVMEDAMEYVESFADVNFIVDNVDPDIEIFNFQHPDLPSSTGASTWEGTPFLTESNIWITPEWAFSNFVNFHELMHATLGMNHWGSNETQSWLTATHGSGVYILPLTSVPHPNKVDYWQEYGVAAGWAGTIQGDDRANSLFGRTIGDTMLGAAGNDTLKGNGGNDSIVGDAGNDSIRGGAGNDTINGNADNDIILGDTNNDSIRGGQGNDNLQGNDGNDTIWGDLGIDTISGGLGADTFYVTNGVDIITDYSLAQGDAIFFV